MTVQQAADFLGVSVRRVGQLYESGQLPKLVNHHTGQVRIPRDAVAKLKKARSTFELVRRAC